MMSMSNDDVVFFSSFSPIDSRRRTLRSIYVPRKSLTSRKIWGVYIIFYVCRSVEFEIDYIRVIRRHVTQLAVVREESAHSLKSYFPIHESLSRLGPF